LDALADRVNQLAIVSQENQEQVGRTSLAVERLADVVMQVAIKVENQVEVITQQQIAMNAELERQGRILDYLMNRDRDD
jgi:phage-related minor tail protein